MDLQVIILNFYRCNLRATFFVFLFSILLTSSADAFSILAPKSGGVSIGKGVSYIEDKDGSLTFFDVRKKLSSWRTNQADVFNRGYGDSVWWLMFDIENMHESNTWLLEIGYPLLDYIDVYVVGDGGTSKHYSLGDKKKFHDRIVQHRNFIIPIHLSRGENTQLYLRVKTSSSIQVPLDLWEQASFYQHDVIRNVSDGIYFGGILIISLYNLLLYFVLRDRTYLYYVANVMSLFMIVASLHGWSFQFLWPNYTQWNDTAMLLSIASLIFFGWAFLGKFLDVEFISPSFSIIQKSALYAAVVMIFLSFFIPYGVAISILLPFVALSCVWGVFAGFVSLSKGNNSARYYVMAWTLLLIGGLMLALSKNQIIPSNNFTNYGAQIGALLEVLLLSFALAERINKERALRMHAQQRALELQYKANEDLESRVHERTLELEEANKQLRELSDTDQLTGLKNRRYLNNFLDKEFDRAIRYGHDLALLMIDVDHFKSINDKYGHLTGDDCLQEIARRIQQQMRLSSDIAARYGGEEFCVVLPETDGVGALVVANRIRETVEAKPVSSRAGELPVTVSVGVAVGHPDAISDIAVFTARADEALYAAKRQGRNKVISHNSCVRAR